MNLSKFETPFSHDPFSLVAMAFENLYPERKYIAYIVPEVLDEDGNAMFGVTTFPDDGTPPVVEISGDNAIVDGIEIFAHELAHVSTPDDHDHGADWERAFDQIYEEYGRLAKQLVADEGKEKVR